MGQLISRYRQQGIPVYVSIDGSIVETYELRPLKVIKPRFNAHYSLNYFRYEPPRNRVAGSVCPLASLMCEAPNIIIGYPGIPDFNCGLILDRENTFKEGPHLQPMVGGSDSERGFASRGHTLNITFRVRDSGPTSFREIFEWHPNLTCISIKLLL